MSFRARLNLFFVLLVVVPLFAVGVVLLRTLDGAALGRTESALASEARAVAVVNREIRQQAGVASQEIADDQKLAAALRADDLPAVRARARQLLTPATPARRIRIETAGGGTVDVGDKRALLPQRNALVSPAADRRPLGELEVAIIDPDALEQRLHGLTGRSVQIREAGNGRLLAGSQQGPSTPPPPGRVRRTDDGAWTAVTVREAAFGRGSDQIVLSVPAAASKASTSERVALIGTLVLFLVLAAIGALLVSRSLQRQVGILLDGSRRLGRGDFDHEIPRQGEDEFAQLADGFNAMSGQLRRRMEELDAERVRLRAAIRRIGESFAANLDREGLLEIVAQAAADGVRADASRAWICVAGRDEIAVSGEAAAFDGIFARAEAQLAAGGNGLLSEGEQHAMAVAMRGDGLHGTVTVARRKGAFTAADAELVAYLSGQATVSLENVGRHEEAEREALTDPLTGLANRRRFDDLLAGVVARARPEGQPVSLLALDLDHFKQVNDQYGHQTGDAVLRGVAWVLRECVRGIDTPARLGGEEFAVILPGTDPEGAWVLAERLRAAIEELRTAVGTDGEEIRVTVSIGTSTLAGTTVEAARLALLADEALYRAKRTGRNKTVTADVEAKPG